MTALQLNFIRKINISKILLSLHGSIKQFIIMKNTTYRVLQGLTVLSVALLLLFTVLKISGAVAWSWWWVCSPVLIPCGITLLALLVLFALLNYLGAQQSKEVQK